MILKIMEGTFCKREASEVNGFTKNDRKLSFKYQKRNFLRKILKFCCLSSIKIILFI